MMQVGLNFFFLSRLKLGRLAAERVARCESIASLRRSSDKMDCDQSGRVSKSFAFYAVGFLQGCINSLLQTYVATGKVLCDGLHHTSRHKHHKHC